MRCIRARRGFTLVEIVFTLTLITLLAALSLWALRPAEKKTPTRGLAVALAEEFGTARRMAIATGHPVALGIPTDDGATPRATSVYRLEGWNKPLVTSSRGFSGDFPEVVFLAARWPGPSFTDGLPGSSLSKFANFQLAQWLPTAFQNDYIFCFTPDGGLVSNSQPAMDGFYTVVVAEKPNVSGPPPNQRVITGADSAITLKISPSGGVEMVTDLPGGPAIGGGGVSAAASVPQAPTQYGSGGATVKISEIRVLPNPDTIPSNQGICVPGQVVTLEVYAYDPEGRALFSKWTQTALETPTTLGQFSYPFSNANPALVGEVEKMEFVYDVPPSLTWVGGATPPAGVGVFRARWNWTVPISSQPGEHFSVQADVRDVKGEVYIENPPPKTFVTPPSGRMLVERRDGSGLWQLVLMNPDGSGEKVLSPPGVEESMPSLDRAGVKMAFLQGPVGARYVKVRNLNGGPEQVLTPTAGNYSSVSISPDGAWVSYRGGDLATGKLTTVRLDGGVPPYIDDQPFSTSGHGLKKSRTGWSQDSRHMIYEKDGVIHSRNLATGATPAQPLIKQFWNTIPGYDGPEVPFAPITYQGASGERIMLSLGANNPVIINLPVTAADYVNGGIEPGNLGTEYTAAATGNKLRVEYGMNGSDGSDNDYPNISTDGQFLTFTRSPQTSGDGHGSIPEDEDDQKVWIIPRSGDNFIMGPGGPTIMAEDDVRRAIWLPSEQ